MRRTKSQRKVAAVFLAAEPGRQWWGYDLRRESGVRSGGMYPLLTRWLEAGYLSDGWEDPREVLGQRPPRRYYELTEAGRAALMALVA